MCFNKLALTLSVVILLTTLACSSEASTDLTRCITPDTISVQQLASGLTVSGEGSLRGAQAVRSKDITDMWFLAADIQGPGMDSPNEIGVWAVSAIEGAGIAPAMWADGYAQNFSTWGTARKDRWFSPNTDGIAESKACVEHLLR